MLNISELRFAQKEHKVTSCHCLPALHPCLPDALTSGLNLKDYVLINLYLTRQVSLEQILIYNNGLGAVGYLPCSRAEQQIFTLSAWGFELALGTVGKWRCMLQRELMLHST
jgi:hypothetical protein